jgi:hypothetical protein
MPETVSEFMERLEIECTIDRLRPGDKRWRDKHLPVGSQAWAGTGRSVVGRS